MNLDRPRNFGQALSAFLLVLLTACYDPDVPGGAITVRNDIRDPQFSTITVSAQGGISFRKELKSGDRASLPKGTWKMIFTRKFADHSKAYLVECPRPFNKQLTINLINVHLNKVGKGCELRKTGTGRYGQIVWDKPEKKQR